MKSSSNVKKIRCMECGKSVQTGIKKKSSSRARSTKEYLSAKTVIVIRLDSFRFRSIGQMSLCTASFSAMTARVDLPSIDYSKFKLKEMSERGSSA
jgi:hypothetical protein